MGIFVVVAVLFGFGGQLFGAGLLLVLLPWLAGLGVALFIQVLLPESLLAWLGLPCAPELMTHPVGIALDFAVPPAFLFCLGLAHELGDRTKFRDEAPPLARALGGYGLVCSLIIAGIVGFLTLGERE